MTDLQERMLAAEREGSTGVDAHKAKAAVFQLVRRRRAMRTGGLVATGAVVVVGLAAAGSALVTTNWTSPPAADPAPGPVDAAVTDASDVSKIDVGAVPAVPVPRRVWDEVDDRWAMAVWAPVNAAWKESFALDYPLLLTAPDGRSWTAAIVKDTITPTILAWDPVAQTALVTSGATDAPQDANIGVISLDGGEDSFTTECLDGTPPVNAERWAAALHGGYVVHNGCGEESFMAAGGVRTDLTEAEHAALWQAKYPRTGVTTVQMSDHDAQVGSTALGMDPSSCTILVRPRQYDVGSGCDVGDGFVIDDGRDPVWVTALPGVAGEPSITKLCGAGTVYGTLSDGTTGVGVIVGNYAMPLMLDGAPATSCVDGRYTWYIAAGDLYFAVSPDAATRVIDLRSAPEDVPQGAGVVSVGPGPAKGSLG